MTGVAALYHAFGADGTTYSGWVKTTDTDGTLMTDGGGVDTATGTGLFVMGGKLTLIGSKGTAGQFNFTVIPARRSTTARWHQFAYTWTGDNTPNGVKLYMDGVVVAQGTAQVSLTASTGIDFGGDPSFPTLPYLNGLLDELSVYNSALSPSAIATIYSLKAAGQTSQGATVSGNLIGTNTLGTLAIANAGGGVVVDSSLDTTVGGTTVAARNQISGNTNDGVTITGAESSGVVVEGNFIGTTASGTAALANTLYGVYITGGATGNTVGGLTSTPGTGAGNLISGNTSVGVYVTSGAPLVGNTVEGNLLGTNAAGTGSVPNLDGVQVNGAPDTTIGGLTSTARNVISGNTGDGVSIISLLGPDSGTVVEGNYVGTDISGTVALANGAYGVDVGSSASFIQIGGLTAASRNVISGNTRSGVFLETHAANNTVQGNYVGTDFTGSAALGNGLIGVFIHRARSRQPHRRHRLRCGERDLGQLRGAARRR